MYMWGIRGGKGGDGRERKKKHPHRVLLSDIGFCTNYNARVAFSNKIQFVVSGACVAFVACMFLFDLTGYDNYIPSYDKIENIAAEFMDGGGWENTYSVEINEDGKISTQDSGYYRNGDLLGNNLGISPDIYACVEQIVKENKVICRSLSEDSDNRALWNGDIWDSSNDTSRLQMRYDLKSGKTVYRSYMVSTENQKKIGRAHV